MKIVHLVTQMEAGGAQRVALLLADGQRRLGHEVEVWFLYVKRPSHLSEPHVKWVSSTRPRTLSDYLKIGRGLNSMLRTHKPDALITHTYYASSMGQILARYRGIQRRVAVQHNPVESYPLVGRWMDRVLGSAGFYTRNVGVSETVMRSLTGYPLTYKDRLTKVYNGILSVTADQSPEEIRRKWGLPLEVPLLLNVGRLARQKNQITLCRALATLPEVHLAIVGDGELRSLLQEQTQVLGVADRVHFLGEMPSQQVHNLLHAADMFVFPSIYEAMPMALAEAMSAGLPIVAGNIPAVREVLGAETGEPAGIIVSPEDPVVLASAVRSVLETPDLALRLRGLARERIQHFTLDAMVTEYERLLG